MAEYLAVQIIDKYDDESKRLLDVVYEFIKVPYTKGLIDKHNKASHVGRDKKNYKLFEMIAWIIHTKVRYFNQIGYVKVDRIEKNFINLLIDFFESLKNADWRGIPIVGRIYGTESFERLINYVIEQLMNMKGGSLQVKSILDDDFQTYADDFKVTGSHKNTGFFYKPQDTKVEKILDNYEEMSKEIDTIIRRFEDRNNILLQEHMKNFYIIAQIILSILNLIYLNMMIIEISDKIGSGAIRTRIFGFTIFPEPISSKSEIFDLSKLLSNEKWLDETLSKYHSEYLASQIGGIIRAYERKMRSMSKTEDFLKDTIFNIYTYMAYRSPLIWEKLAARNAPKLRLFRSGRIVDKIAKDVKRKRNMKPNIQQCREIFNMWSQRLGKTMLSILRDDLKKTIGDVTMKIDRFLLSKYFRKFNKFRVSMSRLMMQFRSEGFKTIPDVRMEGNRKLPFAVKNGWLVRKGNLLPYDVLRVCQILVGASLKFSTYKKKKVDNIEDEDVEEMEKGKLKKEQQLTWFLNNYSKFTFSFKEKSNHLPQENPIPDPMKDYINFALYVEYLPLSLVVYLFRNITGETLFNHKSQMVLDHEQVKSLIYGQYVELYEMAWLMICISKSSDLKNLCQSILTHEEKVRGERENYYFSLDPRIVIRELRKKMIVQTKIVPQETEKREFMRRNFLISRMNRHHMEYIVLDKIKDYLDKSKKELGRLSRRAALRKEYDDSSEGDLDDSTEGDEDKTPPYADDLGEGPGDVDDSVEGLGDVDNSTEGDSGEAEGDYNDSVEGLGDVDDSKEGDSGEAEGDYNDSVEGPDDVDDSTEGDSKKVETREEDVDFFVDDDEILRQDRIEVKKLEEVGKEKKGLVKFKEMNSLQKNMEKFIPSCPKHYINDDEIFNYMLFDKNVRVNVRTKKSTYMYRTLCPLIFNFMISRPGYMSIMNDLSNSVLRHTGIITKKPTTIFNESRARDFYILIEKILKKYTDIKQMKQLNCGREQSLNVLKKILLKFAKEFFPFKMYEDQLEYNYKLYEKSKSKYASEKSEVIRRRYAIQITNEIRMIMAQFNYLLQKTFKENYKKYPQDFVTLMKILFGSKTSIDNIETLFSVVDEKNLDIELDVSTIAKRDIFYKEKDYSNYVRTLNEVRGSPEYGYFHALSDFNNLGQKKVKKYQEFNRLLEMFFMKREMISQFTCAQGNYPTMCDFKKVVYQNLMVKFTERFLKISNNDTKKKYIQSIRDKL